MIPVECPSCGERFAVKDDLAGREIRHRCGQTLQVPAPTEAEEVVAPPSSRPEEKQFNGRAEISIQCAKCGGNVTVPEEVRFATCSYCQSPLEIHRSASAIFSTLSKQVGNLTEGIGRAAGASEGVLDELTYMRLQQELAELNRTIEKQAKERSATQFTMLLIGCLGGLMTLVGMAGMATGLKDGSKGAAPPFFLCCLLPGIMMAGPAIAVLLSSPTALNVARQRRAEIEAKIKQLRVR